MLQLRALGAGRALLKRPANHIFTGAPAFSGHQLFPPPANVRGVWSVHRSLASMTTKSDSAGYDSRIEAIFEKKRALRTQIRKALRSMSPAQRAREGSRMFSTSPFSFFRCLWLFFHLPSTCSTICLAENQIVNV